MLPPPRQPEMRSSFNDLLMALSILNIIYIFTGIVDYTLVKVIIIVPVLTLVIVVESSLNNKSQLSHTHYTTFKSMTDQSAGV